MSPPTDVLGELNEILDSMGADFEIVAEVEVPVTLTWEASGQLSGPIELSTHLRVAVTEDGYRLADADEQAQRIINELRETLPQQESEASEATAGGEGREQ